MKHILLCLSLLVLTAGVFGAAPSITDINIFNSATGSDSWTNNTVVDVNVKFTGDANFVRFCCGQSTCDSNWLMPITVIYTGSAASQTFVFNFGADANKCSSSPAEGATYITAEAANSGKTQVSGVSYKSIVYDKTAPTTSCDKDGEISNSNITATLSCSDNPSGTNSGCLTGSTQFQVDGNGWVTASSFLISTDGNHFIEMKSTDNAGNTETAGEAYIVRDVTLPVINSITNPQGQELNFSLTSDFAPLDASRFRVDINNVQSTDFNQFACIGVDNNRNMTCRYPETKMKNSGDYNVAILIYDKAGNRKQASQTIGYNDVTAPVMADSPSLYSSDSTTIILVWNKNTEQDMNYYKVYRDVSSNFAPNDINVIGRMWQTSCGSSTCIFTDNNGLTADTNYHYRIAAVDLSNNAGNASYSGGPFALGQGTTPETPSGLPGRPVISSSSHPSESTWYSNSSPSFSWGAVSSATGYSWVFDSSSSTAPDTSTETTSTSVSPGGKADGSWYFHVRACNSEGCGETDHFTVNIDTSSPNVPDNVEAQAVNGTIEISWTVPGDTHSGISCYDVWRNRFMWDAGQAVSEPSSSTKVASCISGTMYRDNDVSTGDKYWYKVLAYDNANNKSSPSPQVSATASRGCSASPSLLLNGTSPSYIKAGTYSVIAKFDSGNMYNASLKVRDPDQTTYTSLASGDNVGELSATWTAKSGRTGTAKFEVVADDADGASCLRTLYVTVDTEAPAVQLTAPTKGQRLSGDVQLSGTASDGRALGTVGFLYMPSAGGEWTAITEISGSTITDYSATWATKEVPNGTYNVKIKGTDKAGNSSEQSVEVEVNNAFTPKEWAEQRIGEMDGNFNALDAMLGKLADSGMKLNTALGEKMDEADAKRDEAKAKFDAGNYADAKLLAEGASVLYAEILSKIEVNDFGSSTYEFTEEELGALFEATGIPAELAGEASAFTASNTVSRTLAITEVVVDGETTYYATVTISFTNDGGETMDVQVVEVVPKEFVQFAGRISSNFDFEVLSEDPVIKFGLGEVAAGETVEISYGNGRAMARAEARTLLESAMGNYTAPPMAFAAGVEVTSADFPQGMGLSVMVIGIIVLIAIIAGLVIFITGMKDEHSPSPKGIPAESALDKVKDSIKSLFRPKDEGPKSGKFAWKGD